MSRMKIAYLMLVHKNPRLLERAVRMLSTEDSAFFIHVDRKSNIQDFSEIAGPNIFLSEKRIPVYWAEFSNVEAIIQLIRQVLCSSTWYDYLVFMQGSDYPIRSGRYIQGFLENNRGCEFMSMVKIPAPGYPLSKINKLRYPSDKPVRRFASRALAKLGLAQRDYREYLGGLEPYAGDACWALSRAACHYTVDFAERNSHVEKYFRNAFTSDEMFFHTILGNSPFRDRVRRSLLYRDWPKPGDHPDMLSDTHITFFEEREEVWVEDQFGTGEVLFARKFSDDRLDLLDRIDAMIERKEKASHAPIALSVRGTK
ncbi:MAG: beta-1,6-N-acetylglucosaminyltransferase [Terracidiphilus sp.]